MSITADWEKEPVKTSSPNNQAITVIFLKVKGWKHDSSLNFQIPDHSTCNSPEFNYALSWYISSGSNVQSTLSRFILLFNLVCVVLNHYCCNYCDLCYIGT